MDGTTRAQPQGGYAHATTWAFNRNGNRKSRARNPEPHAHGGSVTNFDLFDGFLESVCRPTFGRVQRYSFLIGPTCWGLFVGSIIHPVVSGDDPVWWDEGKAAGGVASPGRRLCCV